MTGHQREKFIKAVNAEQNGEISRDELLSITRSIVMEVNPKLSDDDVDKYANMMMETDMFNDKIVISSDDGPAMINGVIFPDDRYRSSDESERGEPNPFINIKEGENMEISPETKAKLDRLLARVDELIEPVDSVRLRPSRGETTVFDSKLGGVPYLPKNMKYPTVREGEFVGRPLYLLAQLNFGSLPKIPGFPSEGILQFFAGCADDTAIGMDFKDGFNQNGFRVIYHENVITDKSMLYSEEDMPDFGGGDDYFPFKGEFLLTAEKAEPMAIVETDFRFDKAVAAAYNELFGGDVIGMWDSKGGKGIRQVDEKLYDAVFSRYSSKTRMGGFPFFTQEDPRRYNEEYAKCTVMLFQSDSENGGAEDNWDNEICWGDMGVANFFISPEDLSKHDFSRVLYNWDCT